MTSDKSVLLKYTLLRNREIDLVDFHITIDNEIAVRACHPLAHLDPRELMFAAWMVAAEADRLEFILSGGEDVY